MKYVFHEPSKYGFKDVSEHHGKFFGTNSTLTNHLIVECEDKLTVTQKQNEIEFNYYILKGTGYFIIDGQKYEVSVGDLIVLPPKTKYTFGGKLKMLLINTPHWSEEQEEVVYES